MRGVKGPAAALVVVALAAAACGPAADEPVATSAGASAAQSTPRAASPAASADAPFDRAAFDALLEEWTDPSDDAARERTTARILAAGDPGIARLVELIAAGHERELEYRLALFGERAVPRVTAAFATARGFALARFATALEALAPYWRESEQGPDVCRALLARLTDETADVAVKSALERSRPAGRSIAKDLAERWLHSRSEAERIAALSILQELGSDAAPAAAIVIDAAVLPSPPRRVTDPASEEEREPEWTPPEEDVARFDGAVSILRAIGSGDPSILGELRRRLASGQPADVRRGVAGIVASWGDAGAAAVPELLAMLGDPRVADAASAALLAMPSQTDAIWREIAAAYARGDAWTHEPDDALSSLARRGPIAERLLTLLPTLPADDLVALHDVLADRGNRNLTTVAEALLRNDDPRVRYAALSPWTDDDERRPLPEAVAHHLEDADPTVRARAAQVISARGAAPAARIREVAMALLSDEDRDARHAALDALGPLAENDPAVLDAVLSVLDTDTDAWIREKAGHIIAAGATPVTTEHSATVAWLLGCADDPSNSDFSPWMARVLVRLPGGTAGLARAITNALQSASTSYAEREFVIASIRETGQALAAVRPALVRARDEATGDVRDELDRALAPLSTDAEAVARTGPADEATVRRLLSMGDEGRRATVLLFGLHHPREDAPLRVWFDGVDMATDVAAAARAADPLARERRIGATYLACLLPDARAVELFASIADDLSDGARPDCAQAIQALTELERRSPGAVPADLVAKVVERSGGGAGLELAAALGARGRDLVPLLTRLRDTSTAAVAASAAVTLWTITHDADEALPAIRRILLSPSLRETALMIRWSDLGQALASMPLAKADFDAVLAVVRADVHPAATQALVPLLVRMGADAAPAVPALTRVIAARRVWDSDRGPEPDDAAVSSARVLGTIGAEAKPALPELRRFVAEFGDSGGVFRDAIAKIEAASR
jgi:hypothetical protein